MRLSVLSIIRIGVVVAFFFAYPAKPEKLFIRATVDVMCVRFSICLLFCFSSRCELSRICTRSKIQRQIKKENATMLRATSGQYIAHPIQHLNDYCNLSLTNGSLNCIVKYNAGCLFRFLYLSDNAQRLAPFIWILFNVNNKWIPLKRNRHAAVSSMWNTQNMKMMQLIAKKEEI